MFSFYYLVYSRYLRPIFNLHYNYALLQYYSSSRRRVIIIIIITATILLSSLFYRIGTYCNRDEKKMFHICS